MKESSTNSRESGIAPFNPEQVPLPPDRSRETLGLMWLFAAMYFVQGIAEPTEGLIAQPVRSLLRSWEYSAAAIGSFIFFLSLPWIIKPLYGLLTDFVPLAGTRRRSWLLLSSAATVFGLTFLYFFPPARGEHLFLLLMLLIPTVGVAFSDVVVDAVMVEKGQPRNLTGRLQSVQWTAMNVATVGAALVGGYLSKHGLQTTAFLICALATLVTLGLTWAFVREERYVRPPGGEFRFAAIQLGRALKTPAVLAAAAFLYLWSFNPFLSSSVLYTHMTEELRLGEQFYGVSVSVLAVGQIAASVAYGLYCRRTPVRWLIHGAIVAGILATVAYWGLRGPKSALLIAFVVGFTYMTGSLAQLDLAARACPVAAAGSVFALLMSVSNLAMASSELVGGSLYVAAGDRWGTQSAFDTLVAIGALTTCGCWLAAPLLGREVPR